MLFMPETTFTLMRCSRTDKFPCRRTRGTKIHCATENRGLGLANSVYAHRGQNARQKTLFRHWSDGHRHRILAGALG